jgi:hypothetical protein
MKTLTNSGDFTGSCTRICLTLAAAPQRELESSMPLKKPSANHLPVISKRNTETRFETFEFFTIISGLWSNFQNHRRLPECRNKHFEEGFSKDLQN